MHSWENMGLTAKMGVVQCCCSLISACSEWAQFELSDNLIASEACKYENWLSES